MSSRRLKQPKACGGSDKEMQCKPNKADLHLQRVKVAIILNWIVISCLQLVGIRYSDFLLSLGNSKSATI